MEETPVSIEELKKKLLTLLKKEAFKKGSFVLSSGKTSSYYLDGRVITLTPEGAYLVARLLLELTKDKGYDAIGGPTLGADPIVGAVAAVSHLLRQTIKTFIVRKAAKEHGTQRQIEGPPLKKGQVVLLVDDVATTGKALIEARQALANEGIEAKDAFVIVDRKEGARENLLKEGIRLHSIFVIDDLLT